MKKKTVAIMQPSYLPWVGFFELIYRADVFVVYDTVQFDKNGWRNRNRIKTANGSLWLTVPVKASGRPKLCEAVIDNSKKWRKQHLRSIELNYGKCQYFNDYFPQLEKILNSVFTSILSLIPIRATRWRRRLTGNGWRWSDQAYQERAFYQISE